MDSMKLPAQKAVAIVGVGAVLPDAPDARTFWQNLKSGRYCISEVSRDRWDPDLYYDPDPKAPDKTYSKIGGWARHWEWNPLKWRLPIPPRVSQAMDLTQKWAVVATREALNDYGYPARPLDQERTAVILGNAMAGDMHLYSAARVLFAEYAVELAKAPSYTALPKDVRDAILSEVRKGIGGKMPEITEDTMPGELANIIAGRIAAIYDFKGPNYVADAACASAMAGISAAIDGLASHDFEAVLTGGIDANMSPSTFVKFCKIGALSGTGTRPYAEGADGFVMGEGAVIFLLKRLEDAERDGDRIYAVIRGIGASSDGKGKGITAPNPIGQKLAVKRAWSNAGAIPTAGDLIEGHGTSTRVGDVVEVESLMEAFRDFALPIGSIPLGSVKSNIGHLKGAAGAAGILKAMYALHEKLLPPSVNFHRPNPDIDFAKSPFYVNTSLQPWEKGKGEVRRAGVSAFGFGGTNFHTVLEEYVPGRIQAERKAAATVLEAAAPAAGRPLAKTPLRGALVLGADSETGIISQLEKVHADAAAGRAAAPALPSEAALRAPVRLAIDYADAADLADKAGKALKAFQENQAGRWKALRAKGIFLGRGPAPKVAFLFTGQGSQYVNMLKSLRESEPIVAETFRTADRVMELLIAKPLSACIFLDEADEAAMAAAEQGLKQTAITQPAVLAAETALARMLEYYGILPDMVMGHSLGEYGALVAAKAISFEEALKAVSARGTEMTKAALEDNGMMAAVFGPIDEIAKIIESVKGYVVVANINSTKENVIGGASAAVEKAMAAVRDAGYVARPLPVSHAFHTRIVAPASERLASVLGGAKLQPPALPVISNVTGEFYPMGPGVVPEMIQLLGRQVASPVQFVKGLNTLYQAGVRIFVEVGPKRVLYGFVDDVLGQREDVVPLFTNHPRIGDAASLNLALCGLYAAGLGVGARAPEDRSKVTLEARVSHAAPAAPATGMPAPLPVAAAAPPPPAAPDRYVQLGHLFAEFLERGFQIYSAAKPARGAISVGITGASLGLPGVDRVFDDSNIERILRGDQFIDAIPMHLRRAMLEKNITRLVKSESGEGRFETIEDLADVIKLAARARHFDLTKDFGFPEDRMAAIDNVTMLAIAAGIDAMRDAGIPLVMRYKKTTKGTQLPERWMLPEELRDDTGVIFGSAFPGYDAFAQIISDYYKDRIRHERLDVFLYLRAKAAQLGASGDELIEELEQKIAELKSEIEKRPYVFDRRFLFRVLSMGHSQFAEYIGARGPNTAINAACATGTQGVAMAADWIQSGRCRRVIVISADDITSDNLMEWHGAGFLASGAAATDERVEDAAIPFDRRRHGLIIGMGGAAIVVESLESARERGLQPICEVLGSITANSAYHGSRLDVSHICNVMEKLMADAEAQWGINRFEIAAQTVFVSHETYTPARGGSASAEVFALRHVFKEAADNIVVANTKGATGHPMAVGIEDVVAVKILETGIVPPVANFKEMDPELGPLNLSKGGSYPVRYVLRLGAGFGSQISMTLTRWIPTADGRRPAPNALGFHSRIADPNTWNGWLKRVTGQNAPELEVAQRTLRVRDSGMGARLDNGTGAQPAAKPVSPPPSVMPAAPPPPAPISPLPAAEDAVKVKVMQIVSEKTGYPTDMLESDLDLEADLGIDTVKQAEMFSAIRAAYEIPRDDALKLRDFPTLAHAVQFVYDRRPDLRRPKVQPAAATPPAAPISPPATHPSPLVPDEDAVKVKVMQIISEKTGYPPDMLDLDLDLEADLGIDTVKQAEIFAAIRAAYDIPRDDALKLRDFPTLAHAIQFVYDRRPDLRAADAKPPSAPVSALDTHPSPLVGGLEAARAIARRVPVPRLRPGLELFKSTGVMFGPESRVVVMCDRGGVGNALAGRLEKLGAQALVVEDAPDAGDLARRIEEWKAKGPIQGVFWLPALDQEGSLAEMDLAGWKEATRVRVKLLYATMRALYDQIGEPGTFLVSATRLGGLHGYDDAGAVAPLGGGVAGFTKAFKREKNNALVKVVDFEPSRKTSALADILVDETMLDPGAVEIGRRDGQRWAIGLAEKPAQDGAAGISLSKDTVFLVTGAAGSIVSAITGDLAAASGGAFHLLDLAPEPDPADSDLQRFESDKENLKRDIFERIKARGERATPAMVEKEMAALERRHAALEAIDAIKRAGGSAYYYRVNLLDAQAVAAAMRQVAERSGRVDVLVHAAGLEISHLLPDKSPGEFDLVFDVKADGWFNLLSNLGSMSLGAAVVFSSVAGRFGNLGQTDYSSANDLLCKCVTGLRRARPQTRGIAVDWTAWGGIGMASRGSIPEIMKQAGIDMLAPEAGIPIVRRELTEGGFSGEVVVARSLGMMMQDFDESGGLSGSIAGTGIMTGKVVRLGLYEGLTVETILDPARQPFLYDHQIGGTPVLPGVMGIEGLTEVAKVLFPERYVGSVEDVNFTFPFKFYRGQPRTVILQADFGVEGDDIVADCRLVGTRTLHGQVEPEVTTHFTARVRLLKEPPQGMKHGRVSGAPAAKQVTAADLYRLYFHGPAYQVVESAWRSADQVIGLFSASLPPNHEPVESPAIVWPRLIELCFQTAGISELVARSSMGLPHQLDRLRILDSPANAKGRLFAVVTPNASGGFDAQVADEKGNVYMALEGYRTAALPEAVAPELLKPLQSAIG